MSVPVTVDPKNAELFLKYARLVSARGYVHNTLGNMVMRVPHPAYLQGVAYTKHAGLSLEEMELENIVITDIPTSNILYGNGMTSLGHNLNREIFKLRPEINAAIHVHDDATIAFFRLGRVRRVSHDLHRAAICPRQARALFAGTCQCRG